MALSKDAQKKLLQALKLDDATITDLVDSAEEKDFSVPDGTKVFDAEGFSKLKGNIENSTEVRNKYRELTIKDLKEKAGLEFDGKDPEKFIAEYKNAILAEANIGVDEKVTKKDAKIKEQQDKIESLIKENQAIGMQKKQLETDTRMMRSFPKDKGDMSDEDYLVLSKSRGVEIKEEDGAEVVYYKGQKLQDDKLTPLPLDKAIEHVFKSENWLKSEGQGGGKIDPIKGRGAGDSKIIPGAINTMSQFKKHCEEQNIHLSGNEAQAKLADVVKANPNFSFNE